MLPTPEDPLFLRYVAIGNSITAGFESAGINDSTQANSYALQFARRFNAPFTHVRVRKPGCPAPLTGSIAVTASRVGGTDADDCSFLSVPFPTRNHNLSVPGAKIADALRRPQLTSNLLFDLFIEELYEEIFGGSTLLQAMVNAQPTLVSVWLGNNDVLSAATTGDLERMTPLEDFVNSLDQVVAAIADQTAAEDAIWLGILDPQHVPLLQPGLLYWLLAQNSSTHGLIGNKPVLENCAPSSGSGANPLAANLISAAVVRDPETTEISCAPDASWLLNPQEQASLTERVVAFNEAIQSRAASHGWIYLDTNALILERLADPNLIRKCQGLLSATNEQQLIQLLLSSCPNPTAPNFFGSLVSYDGIHPSAEGQRVIADRMELLVRAKHGL